jgi:hypothetical protein
VAVPRTRQDCGRGPNFDALSGRPGWLDWCCADEFRTSGGLGRALGRTGVVEQARWRRGP